jgi:ADP-ribose pyrophosphatase
MPERPEPVGREPAFEGHWVRVDIEDWGERGGRYEVVRRAGAAREGAVAIVARTPADELLLVRMFRPAIGQQLVELPAGLLDRADEDPIACARRELLEETGHDTTAIEFLAGIYPSAGLADEYAQLFVAEATAEPVATTDGEVDEVLRMPFDDALRAARAGRFRDAKTGLGILLSAERMGRGR